MGDSDNPLKHNPFEALGTLLKNKAVQIIHGRGISSGGDPVLKTKVFEWLTRSHWRKWVSASPAPSPTTVAPGQLMSSFTIAAWRNGQGKNEILDSNLKELVNDN